MLTLQRLYVAFPNKAQDAINDAELIVTSQDVLSPSPSSFYLDQTVIFLSRNDETVSLDAWKGSLCLERDCKYPFAEIEVPKSEAKNGTEIQINPSRLTKIGNMTEFYKYTQLALGSEEYSIYLKGKGRLHKGAWPATTVDYNKNLTMKGIFLSSTPD